MYIGREEVVSKKHFRHKMTEMAVKLYEGKRAQGPIQSEQGVGRFGAGGRRQHEGRGGDIDHVPPILDKCVYMLPHASVQLDAQPYEPPS